MARVVGEKIHTRITTDQPTGKEVNRKWKAIHLDKECNDEGRERAERAPITNCPWLREAEGEDNKDQRVYYDQ
jgi:hypothetical protein